MSGDASGMAKRTSVAKKVVVVIGGGAAGLLAATVAAQQGARVLLLEKNQQLGKKLRITGGGRCNITNNTPHVRELLSRYGEAGKFLFSPFAQFGVKETRAWFETIGVETVEEAERRVFPISQSAVVVTEALIRAAKTAGVTIVNQATVQSVLKPGARFFVHLATRETIEADAVIVATGGTSRPDTGSTGDALPWLAAFGHTIETPSVALVPIALKETDLARRLSGVALSEAGITLYRDDEVVKKVKGKILFTHTGMSGPAILNLSQQIGECLQEGRTTLALDFLPHQPKDVLEETLLARLIASPNKLIRNQWSELLPGALVIPVLEACQINPQTPSHSLTVGQRRSLVATVKAFRVTVDHLLGEDKAVVSSGGVALPEIDFRTMESRLVPSLYVVGDVLNINRPSGGYSLQLAWTTGYVAGAHASQ